jgi:hypothetical protein
MIPPKGKIEVIRERNPLESSLGINEPPVELPPLEINEPLVEDFQFEWEGNFEDHSDRFVNEVKEKISEALDQVEAQEAERQESTNSSNTLPEIPSQPEPEEEGFFSSIGSAFSGLWDETVDAFEAIGDSIGEFFRKYEKEINQITGALQVIEASVIATVATGLLVAPEPTMLTKVLGGALLFYAADLMTAGINQAQTGEVQHTLTNQAIEGGAELAGVDPEVAQKIADYTEFFATLLIPSAKKMPATAKGGNLVDEVYDSQKKLVDQHKESIASANNFRKGNFGEMATDVNLSGKGYKPLHTRVTDIDAPMKQGIDGVFEKNGEFFIVESKYSGTSKLGKTNTGRQMSDNWINGSLPGKTTSRLEDTVGKEMAIEIQNVGYKSVLSEVASDGSITYKLINSDGSVGSIIDL